FVVFAHVNEPEFFARVEFAFHFGGGDFANTRFGVFAEFFKCFRMLHRCSFLESRLQWEKPIEQPDCPNSLRHSFLLSSSALVVAQTNKSDKLFEILPFLRAARANARIHHWVQTMSFSDLLYWRGEHSSAPSNAPKTYGDNQSTTPVIERFC